MNKVRFDFGTGPETDGFIKISPDTLYTDTIGYGISKKAEGAARGIGEKPFCRDFLLLDENTFTVKLDNGTYSVRLYCGDYVDEGDVTTKAEINGKQIGFWVNDGTVAEQIHQIEVTDGKMTFAFSGRHAAVNAIEIAPALQTSVRAVTPSVTAAETAQSVTLSWDAPDGICSYAVVRKNVQNRHIDRRWETNTPEFTDSDVRLCHFYEYTVYGLDSYKLPTPPSPSVRVQVVDGKPLTGSVQNLFANPTEISVALEWDDFPGALSYHVYQKAPYGMFKRIATVKHSAYIDDEVDTVTDFTYAVEAVTTSGVTEKAEILVPAASKPFRRKMETLNRGLVAMNTQDGVFLSWRLNGYEYEKDIDFILLRNGERITEYPICDSTNYLDRDGKSGDTYTVKAVHNNKAEKHGDTTTVIDGGYLPIPLDKPAPYTTPDGNTYEYTANDAAVGDLDGDGEYELILKWVANGKDNSHKGYTGVVYLDAYKLNGKKLWRIDLGVNIRAGAHYTQFMVYDFNNDGKAELICKTADGTIDGVGGVIGDKHADYRNKDGFILDGPEFLTVFDGETGKIIDTVDYDPPRGNVADWGDSWGNRVDRFLACVAYLDGVNPSVVMCRGYYDDGRPTAIVAYDMIDNKLVKRWKFLANKDQNIEYTNQGNHSVAVGDVDGDGKDEIVYGSCAIDHDGKGIYSTGLEHGDAMHLGNFTPETPNLDFFQIHEHAGVEYGFEMHNPATGEIYWGRFTGYDTGRGLCANIDPRHTGNEAWALGGGLYTFDGKLISEKEPDSINFAIWWDGDLLRELLDHDFDGKQGIGQIYKWDYENQKLDVILDTKDAYSNNFTKGNPCIQADLFGDWREEVVWRNEDSTELRIYTTTHLTDHKFYTLMHDDVYRLSVAWQNTAYNQPPHTGFYIGDGMKKPPVPNHEYVNGENIPEFTEEL